MGTYIITGILFLFFMGVMSLVMDSLTTRKKQNYIIENTDQIPATVLLEENYNIDFEKITY